MLRRSLLALAIAAYPASTAVGGVFWTTNQSEFEAYMEQTGKVLKTLETFEGLGVPPNTIQDLMDPFQADNVIIQSNISSEQYPPKMIGHGLVAVGPNFFQPGSPNSVVVGTFFLDDSLDLIFAEGENHTGVGFDYFDPSKPPRMMRIIVYDKNDVPLFKIILPADRDKKFFGIWVPITIGRINLAGFDPDTGFNGLEHVDNIEMWVPAPGTLALLGLGGFLARRRRRR